MNRRFHRWLRYLGSNLAELKRLWVTGVHLEPFHQGKVRSRTNQISGLVLGNPTTGDSNLTPLILAEREAQAIAILYDAQLVPMYNLWMGLLPSLQCL